MMKIMHVGLIVADLAEASIFYEQIIGLTRIDRPEFGFDGLWYGLDGGQQLHLMRLENPYATCAKPQHGGRDNHVAMQTNGFDAIRRRLETAKISYSLSKSGRSALFCRDPDGNTLELFS